MHEKLVALIKYCNHAHASDMLHLSEIEGLTKVIH